MFSLEISNKYDGVLDPTEKPIVAEFEYFGGTRGQSNPTNQSPLITKIKKNKLNASLLWEVAETIEKPVFEIDENADVYDLDYFLT